LNHSQLKTNSVIRDIVLTVITFGFWNLYVQFRQIEDVNEILRQPKLPSLLKVVLLPVLTLGLYFCFYEYKLTKILHQLNYQKTYTFNSVACGIMTLFGLWFIVDSYQQSLINDYIEKHYPRGGFV
jgi:hypothetical protein